MAERVSQAVKELKGCRNDNGEVNSLGSPNGQEKQRGEMLWLGWQSMVLSHHTAFDEGGT